MDLAAVGLVRRELPHSGEVEDRNEIDDYARNLHSNLQHRRSASSVGQTPTHDRRKRRGSDRTRSSTACRPASN
jgi:hypothetical protein